MADKQSSVKKNVGYALGGMDLDSTISQVHQGKVTYCLNGTLEGNTDGSVVYYQNERGNSLVCTLPEGTQLIGKRAIIELDKYIMLLFSSRGEHEIGYFDFVKNSYTTLTKGSCLNFDRDHPINQIEYEINGDAVRIYWADNYNPDRYLDINRLAFGVSTDGCAVTYSDKLDCNRLKVQPNFGIPFISDTAVVSGGELLEGTYQFGIQYADAIGTQYTSVYNFSNPVPVFKGYVSQDFNLPTDRAINVTITNLDTTIYQYYNLIVAKTVNNITTFQLVGTYSTSSSRTVLYTGKYITDLSPEEAFQKFPIYERSNGVTQADKTLVWYGVTESKRINYQEIASKIKLTCVRYKIPYTQVDDINLQGYMGDEVYAFEFQPILKSGKKCDGFHIPGRLPVEYDLEIIPNPLSSTESLCSTEDSTTPRWRVKNTASLLSSTPLEETISIDITPYQNTIDQLNANIKELSDELEAINKLISGQREAIATIFKDPIFGLTQDQYLALYDEVYSDDIDPNDFHWGNSGTIAQQISDNLAQAKTLTDQLADDYVSLTEAYNAINEVTRGTAYCEPTPIETYQFGYYESEELYPCNEDIWGDLAGQPIRHHKFPKNTARDDSGNYYILSPRVDISSVVEAIKESKTLTQEEKDDIVGFKILRADRVANESIVAKGTISNVGIYTQGSQSYFYPNYPYNDNREDPFLSVAQTKDDSGHNPSLRLNGFSSPETKKRFIFHSPETHFYQPTLGDYIELEHIIYGTAKGHFVPVKDHPRYQIPSRATYATVVAITIALVGAGSKEGTSLFGVGDLLGGASTPWDEALSVYLSAMDIIGKSIPHKQLAYQFNSVGEYTLTKDIPDSQETIYPLSPSSRYVSDGLANIQDIYQLNNFLRETGVYLKVNSPIPFTHELYPEVQDTSRYLASDNDCDTGIHKANISTYYASLKRILKSQYGQMYSYKTIDTGYYCDLQSFQTSTPDIFGGDIFVGQFSYKTKLSLFTQNLVKRQDGLALDFRNFPSIAYPTYWLSNERDGHFTWGDLLQEGGSILAGAAGGGLGSMSIAGIGRGAIAGAVLGAIGVLNDNWQNNFDCAGKKFFYQDGKFYLFVYGIPQFTTESTINLKYRQAYNSLEGDFFPHAGGEIPDEWLQEVNVPIVNDNTYWYNKTYSKQNMEDYFSHVPEDYDHTQQLTHTNRAIYSEKQSSETDYKINKWLLYRPVSFHDFPQTNGKLTALDKLENNAVLARYENTSELYNTMLRIDTSNPQAVYLGTSSLFESAPPIEYSSTDTGYIGSQHKTLLKTEYGALSVDSERGNIFLIAGQKAKDITQGISKFLSRNSRITLQDYFDIDIDNSYNGVGYTAVYDSNLKRAIITKLDYEPLMSDISYNNGQFAHNKQQISLTDPQYFKNLSFTISFDLEKQVPVSFHTYMPNYYIQTPSTIYSNSNNAIWQHNDTVFNTFYDITDPYIIEYPYSAKAQQELLQSVQDSTKVVHIDPSTLEEIEQDNVYFDESIIYSTKQCSGTLKLTRRPVGQMASYMKYPVYNENSKEILYTKSGRFYQYNTFWSLIKDKTQPLFIQGPNLSQAKVINNDNMDYSKRFFKKEPIISRDLKIRHTAYNKDYKYISEFMLTQTQDTYK